MLEVKNAVFPSPQQWQMVVRGAAAGGDSELIEIYNERDMDLVFINGEEHDWDEDAYRTYCDIDKIEEDSIAKDLPESYFILGNRDKVAIRELLIRHDNRTVLEQLPVLLEVTAPLEFWKTACISSFTSPVSQDDDQTRIWTLTYNDLHYIAKYHFDDEMPEYIQLVKWIWSHVPMAQEFIFDDWEREFKTFRDWGVFQFDTDEDWAGFLKRLEDIETAERARRKQKRIRKEEHTPTEEGAWWKVDVEPVEAVPMKEADLSIDPAKIKEMWAQLGRIFDALIDDGD